MHPETRSEAVARDTGASWQPVEVTARDGSVLRGSFFRPAEPNGDLVLALHGLGSSRSGVFDHTRLLLRHRYSVLAIDSRAHGVSGGEQVTYGVLERSDIHTWADWAFATEHPATLYGLGGSMGAAILLQAIPSEPRFRGIVAEGAFSDFRSIAYTRMSQWTGMSMTLADWITLPVVEPGVLYGRLRYGVNLFDASPLAAIRHASIPVFLIHGTGDQNVPPGNSLRLHEANPNLTDLWTPEGAGHVDALGHDPVEYENRVIAWLKRHR